MLPDPLPEREQVLPGADFEARVARRVRLAVHPDRDVHLLAGGADVEPREVVLAVRGDGVGFEPECGAVEGDGVREGGGGDEKVDVCEGEDHGCWVGLGGVWLVGWGLDSDVRVWMVVMRMGVLFLLIYMQLCVFACSTVLLMLFVACLCLP